MADLDIAELERLVERATPGPWRKVIVRSSDNRFDDCLVLDAATTTPDVLTCKDKAIAAFDWRPEQEANADLVAAAPAAIRSLIERVKVLEEPTHPVAIDTIVERVRELEQALRDVRVYVQGSIEETHDKATLGNLYGARDDIDAALRATGGEKME